MKKPIKFILYILLIIVGFFWVAKQFGYPLNWYVLNGKYNYLNTNKIETETFNLKVPYWKWKVLSNTEKSSKLEGISSDRTFILALIRKEVELYNLESIKKMCKGDVLIDSYEQKSFQRYNIYCNRTTKQLKAYRVFWIKNKVFVYMNDYNKKYQDVYDELISSIELK